MFFLCTDIAYSKLLCWLAVNQSPSADFQLVSTHRQKPWLCTRYTWQGYFQSPHNFISDFAQKLLLSLGEKLFTFEMFGILEEIFTPKRIKIAKSTPQSLRTIRTCRDFKMIFRCIFIILKLISTLY